MNNIFEPNLTTKLIIKTILELDIKPEEKFLDLGCGNGVISRSVAKKFGLTQVFGSDISTASISESNRLSDEEGLNSEYKVGNCLTPWEGYKFDFISCDIAAISSTIADLSDWYDGVSCDTGANGLRLVSSVIEDVESYLSDAGIFIIPIISLADHNSLEGLLKKKFSQVHIVNKKQWPIPSKLKESIEQEGLKFKTKNWVIEEKYELYCAHTSLAICKKIV